MSELTEANQKMLDACATPNELLESGVQGLCVVEPVDIGNAVMFCLQNYWNKDWSDEEKAAVGNFLELVYQNTQDFKERNPS